MADDQTLRIDLGQEPPTLDPNKAQDNASIAVLREILDTLGVRLALAMLLRCHAHAPSRNKPATRRVS